ncbi:MAG: hypothetical protein RI900_3202, partial [Actinomycetota bacterium]
HAGSINAYIALVLGSHRSLVCSIENTCDTVVRVGDHGPTLVTTNDCHHLYDTVLGAV